MPGDSAWLSLIGMAAVVVLVLVLAYWFTRLMAGGKAFQSLGRLQKGGRLQILDQLQLGKDQRLVVVQVGARCFVLGVTAQSISLLTELDSTESEEWLREWNEQKEKQAPEFKQAFLDAWQSRKKR